MLGVGRAGAWRLAEAEAVGIGPGMTAEGDSLGPTTPVARSGTLTGEERDAWVVLDSVIGVGPVSFARLIAAFGEARGVLEAARRPRGASALVAASAGLGDGSPTLSRAVADAVVEVAADPLPALVAVDRAGVRAVTAGRRGLSRAPAPDRAAATGAVRRRRCGRPGPAARGRDRGHAPADGRGPRDERPHRGRGRAARGDRGVGPRARDRRGRPPRDACAPGVPRSR